MRCTNCGFENDEGGSFCINCGSRLSRGGDTIVSDDQFSIGPYAVISEIDDGRGSMARVWRAWDSRLQREVAIKEPLFDARYSLEQREMLAQRFLVEGRAAARLSAHPNIVVVHAADVYSGVPVIVMEFVKGNTLTQILSEQGRLETTLALSYLNQLLDAVGYAHAHGVIHRDIKPGNIFVTADNRLKLGDFGIAHLDCTDMTSMTTDGAVLGTPGYMSPEQVLGQPVDERSDVFSIGVVAYEMLTGRNPFGVTDGASVATLLHRIAYEDTDPQTDAILWQRVPENVASAIMAALSKSPQKRPSSAEQFKAMLGIAGMERERSGEVVTEPTPGSHGEGDQGGQPPVGPNNGGQGDARQRNMSPGWVFAMMTVAAVLVALVAMVTSSQVGGGGAAASTLLVQPSEESSTEDPAVSTPTDDEQSVEDPADSTQADPAPVEDPADSTQADPAPAEDGNGLSNEDYILPESSTRYYSYEELNRLTDWELWMARNEIYARHGRKFSDTEARRYFESKWWYEGIYSATEYSENGRPRVYNDYESANRDLIEQIEHERGTEWASW